MNLTDNKFLDLVKPTDFKITTNEDVIERLVERINDELLEFLGNNENADGENPEGEIYNDTILSIELECNEGDTALKENIFRGVIDIFQTHAGWKVVTYSFIDETKNDYAYHKFSFYFNSPVQPQPQQHPYTDSDLKL